jgi:spermidine synthase
MNAAERKMRTDQMVSKSVFGYASALTIFLGAFLLFQIQPVMAKHILPLFGGTTAVWSTCMLFFQFFLLLGYVYSHLLFVLVPARHQGILHVALLLLTLLFFDIVPSAHWHPDGIESPALHILALLTVHLGLPYFALATTAPLIQAWFGYLQPDSSPYRLYALSNTASLMALLSYPLFWEYYLSTPDQMSIWSSAFTLYALSMVLCCALLYTGAKRSAIVGTDAGVAGNKSEKAHPPSVVEQAIWLVLAACGVILQLAVTNHVCHDIATVPFLWIVPLSLYLLSFIACFERKRWYLRNPYTVAGILLILVFSEGTLVGPDVHVILSATIAFLTLFVCCMICHGELVRLKPHSRYITRFYLLISLGGAIGGAFVSLLAPAVFSSFLELPIGFAILGGTLLIIHRSDRTSPLWRWQFRRARAYAGIFYAGFLAALLSQNILLQKKYMLEERNFYGLLRIYEEYQLDPLMHRRLQIHGNTLHGSQFLSERKRNLPTEYYGASSGVGLLLRHCKIDQPRRIGVVGLGVGTLLTYATEKDHFRFYEINPTVIRQSSTLFSFRQICRGTHDVVPGDGRLSLERGIKQDFDILVLDAFSSGAIPVHLLTEEAFMIYLNHLRPDGVLAIHITNRHLDLVPVLSRAADKFGLSIFTRSSLKNVRRGVVASDWVLMSKHPGIASRPFFRRHYRAVLNPKPIRAGWTDNYNNLFEILK